MCAMTLQNLPLDGYKFLGQNERIPREYGPLFSDLVLCNRLSENGYDIYTKLIDPDTIRIFIRGTNPCYKFRPATLSIAEFAKKIRLALAMHRQYILQEFTTYYCKNFELSGQMCMKQAESSGDCMPLRNISYTKTLILYFDFGKMKEAFENYEHDNKVTPSKYEELIYSAINVKKLVPTAIGFAGYDMVRYDSICEGEKNPFLRKPFFSEHRIPFNFSSRKVTQFHMLFSEKDDSEPAFVDYYGTLYIKLPEENKIVLELKGNSKYEFDPVELSFLDFVELLKTTPEVTAFEKAERCITIPVWCHEATDADNIDAESKLNFKLNLKIYFDNNDVVAALEEDNLADLKYKYTHPSNERFVRMLIPTYIEDPLAGSKLTFRSPDFPERNSRERIFSEDDYLFSGNFVGEDYRGRGLFSCTPTLDRNTVVIRLPYGQKSLEVLDINVSFRYFINKLIEAIANGRDYIAIELTALTDRWVSSPSYGEKGYNFASRRIENHLLAIQKQIQENNGRAALEQKEAITLKIHFVKEEMMFALGYYLGIFDRNELLNKCIDIDLNVFPKNDEVYMQNYSVLSGNAAYLISKLWTQDVPKILSELNHPNIGAYMATEIEKVREWYSKHGDGLYHSTYDDPFTYIVKVDLDDGDNDEVEDDAIDDFSGDVDETSITPEVTEETPIPNTDRANKQDTAEGSNTVMTDIARLALLRQMFLNGTPQLNDGSDIFTLPPNSFFTTRCQGCNRTFSTKVKFCPLCGQKTILNYASCPRCGKELDKDSTYCPNCGERIGS